MLLDESPVEIHPLLAHDGLEVNEHLFAGHILGYGEVLTVPAYALIVAATAGLGGFQSVDMRSTDHLPKGIVEGRSLGTLGIAQQEPPAFVEVIDDASAALQGEQSGYRYWLS